MTAAIEVRNLCYTYPDGTEALRHISFRAETGLRVGLIGPNGAGKSTLLHHLNGLLPESRRGSASVLIDGEPIDRSNILDVRRRVGLLFQDPGDQLFCPTVGEDVAFGPEQMGLADGEIRRRVRDALEHVGLSGFESREPHHLSAGEKRRVCLAGVLACDPSILLLDEPSSSLDPRGRRELLSLLRQTPLTQIIASHDLEMMVELCQQVVVMDKGQIVAHGPTLELLSDEPLMLRHGLERPHILQHRHPHD
ncbi:MAG: energy-coupling factor ABC transporter ATP-binding protein [Baekduia sp.]